ncbi:MAG: hypothetical protein KAI66_06385 [Lentisphaeria bacterium]|nr:hypothetical protein [Lentisphaeria bacterium]
MINFPYTLLLACLVVGIHLVWKLRRARRSSIYARLVKNCGLQPVSPHALHVDPDDFPELNVCTRCLRATVDGFEVAVFENDDIEVEEGGPPETQTYVMVTHPSLNLPHFLVEPRSAALKMRTKIEKNKGIFFPKDELFTKNNFVDGPDRDAVKAMLSPEFLAMFHHNTITIEGRGSALLVYRPEVLAGYKVVQERMDIACRAARILLGPM